MLSAGLDELRNRPVVPPRFLEGLQDTLEVIAVLRSASAPIALNDSFDACLGQLRCQCAGPTPRSAKVAHEALCRIRALAATLTTAVPPNHAALRQWTEAFLEQAAAVHRELLRCAFWLRMPRRNRPAGAPSAKVSAEGAVHRETALGELYDWIDAMDARCTVGELPGAAEQLVDRLDRLPGFAVEGGEGSVDPCRSFSARLGPVRRAAEQAAATAREQQEQIGHLTGLCRQFCEMDFAFLFHSQRKLLSIGFQAGENRRDEGCYDLLASEARLTSFLAVSHGKLPLDHWSALGRTMTLADGKPVLLSWSGSVFEYLMPALLMPNYAGTLLESSCRAAVRRHIRYARRHGLPWGMSESCFNLTDEHRAYQYRSHGVPGLGLKRRAGRTLGRGALCLGAGHDGCAARRRTTWRGWNGRAASVLTASTTRSILRRLAPTRGRNRRLAGSSWRTIAE